MGMHIGIDDVEADESVNSKDNLKSMSAQDVSEVLPPHGFGVPDLYPDRVYDDSHDEGYDSV